MKVCHLGGFLFAAICLIQCSAVGQNVGPSSTQRPDAGSVQGNTFKSNFFGFSYRFPTGWTVLNQESQSRIRLAKGKLYTLLFAKSASPGRIINPSDAAIVILAEEVSQTDVRDGSRPRPNWQRH